MSFPTSPTNGQTATINNIIYEYNSSSNSWTRILDTFIFTATTSLLITNSTNATSTTTGALQVIGGIGAKGDIWGKNIYANDFYYSATSARQPKITVGTTAPTSPAVGDLWVDTN